MNDGSGLHNNGVFLGHSAAEPAGNSGRPQDRSTPVRFAAWAGSVGRGRGTSVLRFHLDKGQRLEVALPKKVAESLAREILGLTRSTSSGLKGVES